jgi:hypothetical protein
MSERPGDLDGLVVRGAAEREELARVWRSAEYTVRETASEAGAVVGRSVSQARWAGALFAVGALLLRFRKLRSGYRWASWILRFAPPLVGRLHLFGGRDSKKGK